MREKIRPGDVGGGGGNGGCGNRADRTGGLIWGDDSKWSTDQSPGGERAGVLKELKRKAQWAGQRVGPDEAP